MTDLEIKKLVELVENENNELNLKALFKDYHPYDVAIILKELPTEKRKLIYKVIDEKKLADVFEYLDSAVAAEYLDEMAIQKASNIINEMEPDDACDVINTMDDENVESILAKMPKEDANELSMLKKFEDGTAGAMMSTNYISLQADMDVKDAMKYLVKNASDLEVIDPLFVCKDKILLGLINLKDLIIARSPKKISELMNPFVISASINESKNEVVKKIKDYDINAIPVTDNKKLVGIITMDDAIDEAVGDIMEDSLNLVGVSNTSKTDNIFKNMLKRLPWLICLLVASLLISNITSTFEEVIVQVTIFAFFQSLVFDMAGNAGTQSLAVTIRNISRGEMNEAGGIIKHITKEFFTALITSLILATLTFVMSYLYLIIRGDDSLVKWLVALIISGSLMVSLLLTEMLGALIPIIFHKLKIDPAVASGPLITTLSDTISIVVYFGVASLLLNYLIL